MVKSSGKPKTAMGASGYEETEHTNLCHNVNMYTFDYNQIKVSIQTNSINLTKWLSIVDGPSRQMVMSGGWSITGLYRWGE
jgi:hypothetical protein